MKGLRAFDPERTLTQSFRPGTIGPESLGANPAQTAPPQLQLRTKSVYETTTARPHIPAPAIRQGDEFAFAMNQFIAETIRASLAHMIAPENTLRLHHGRSWGDSGSYAADGGGTLKKTSAQASVHFDGIIRNDLSQLPLFLHSLIKGMSSAITRDIYQTVSDVADKTGNVVSQAAAGSPAKAFLEMLRKIEFGVNANGEVTLPSLHVSPEHGANMLADLNAQGPEFVAEVDRLKQEKAAAALRREHERLSKYRK